MDNDDIDCRAILHIADQVVPSHPVSRPLV